MSFTSPLSLRGILTINPQSLLLDIVAAVDGLQQAVIAETRDKNKGRFAKHKMGGMSLLTSAKELTSF